MPTLMFVYNSFIHSINQSITEPTFAQLHAAVEYEVDSDDDMYLELQENEGGTLDRHDLEQLMDLCEKETVKKGLVEVGNTTLF
jgi:hypothetical protein